VIAFERHEDAAQVCQTLRDSGYSKQACSIHMDEKVAKPRRNIDDAGFMARKGKSVAAAQFASNFLPKYLLTLTP
jgi:hypothetical protein